MYRFNQNENEALGKIKIFKSELIRIDFPESCFLPSDF